MSEIQKELVRLSDAWMQAIATNDVAKIEPFMANEWVLVTQEGGPLERRRFLEAVASGDLVHHAMRSVGDTLVQVYGDSAVLISRVQNQGAYQGQPFAYDEWSTDTYVKEGERWRCVVTALTPIPSA